MQIWIGRIKMSAFIIDVKPDNLLCANPAKKDRNFENYFTGEIRTKIDNLPFNLYTNYKVYIKCQILYFLYLNPYQKFTIGQIIKPIIDFVMKHSKKRSKLKREDVKLCCKNAVKKMAENFTILTGKYNKTKFNKYFFNPAYEQLFDYDLFWNEAFIAKQLENRQYFHTGRILKFCKFLNFIGDKVVSAKEIANSYLFGDYPTFQRKILNPLIKMNLIKGFKQGRDYCYCLNTNENFPREILNIF